MPVPSYTTDLNTFNACTSNTGWVEMTGMAQGGGADLDTDLGIVSDRCISELIRKTGLASLAYNNGSGVTIPTNGGFFVWSKYQASNSIGTRANGGIGVVIGSATGTWGNFNMDGSDTIPYGGWVNYFVDPSLTPDSTNGTYNTTYQYCGTSINVLNAVSKGNPQSIDFMRYGRGTAIFTEGDLGNGYATFAGFAAVNDVAATARWGLFQQVKGGYLWKGLMSLGITGTLVDMRDSNIKITIDDTIKAAAPFNRIEVHNASSNIEWTAVSFDKVGTISKGEFEMIDNATVSFTGCGFTDMSTFIFQSNASLTTTTWRRCDLVTAGGASFTSCNFNSSISSTSILSTDLGLITGSVFTSDGSNHAVELNTIGVGSMDWDNAAINYVAGTSGSPVVTTSTGNEVIYVNVGSGTLNINVATGASVPSVRSAGAVINVIAGAVQFLVKVQDTSGVAIQDVRVLAEAGIGGAFPSDVTVTITRAAAIATVTHTSHGLSNGDKVVIRSASPNDYNGVWTISNVTTNTYDYTVGGTPTTPATGTIKSTFALLSGLTDINGELSITRTYSVDTPISSDSKARKSTSSPYYKTGAVVGTISKDTGLSSTIIMLNDE